MQTDFVDTVPLSMVARIDQLERQVTSHWSVEFDELNRMAQAELELEREQLPKPRWWEFWKRRCGRA